MFADYVSEKNDLGFGSLLGRFNSFISNGEIRIGKKDYALSTNVKGIHHEKGGHLGFDKVSLMLFIQYNIITIILLYKYYISVSILVISISGY